MIKHLPNAITLFNLFCGACAILYILKGHYVTGAYFIAAGGIADYLDGSVARWLGVKSELGKQLDSLADVITFGLVQGVIIYTLFCHGDVSTHIEPAHLVAFILPMFAGLRLGRFNIDTRQTSDFIGLNTPATTVFMTGLLLIFHYDSYGLREWITQPLFLYAIILLFSFFMNMELPIFGFKFQSAGWRGNEWRWSFLGLSLLLLIVFREVGLSLVIILYLLMAALRQMLRRA